MEDYLIYYARDNGELSKELFYFERNRHKYLGLHLILSILAKARSRKSFLEILIARIIHFHFNYDYCFRG